MNSMTNDDVCAVVDEEEHTVVYDAVRKTVLRAVDRTVYGSVHDAVDEALYRAVRRSADNDGLFILDKFWKALGPQ